MIHSLDGTKHHPFVNPPRPVICAERRHAARGGTRDPGGAVHYHAALGAAGLGGGTWKWTKCPEGIVGTLPKTNIDPDHGPLEECFPLPTSGFQGPC